MWTPVNEPLTTARFSGLYGHWYPHRESEADFLRMLVIECRAVLLAMRAIRRVTPQAELIQTDDLGKCFATPPMQAVADEHNERRWLSFDLLAGRVDARHPWHARFLRAGVPTNELEQLRHGELGQFTVGINHYVTSDRFLDHRQSLYPTRFYDVNGPDLHVDTEALCVALPEGSTGWLARLREAWARYPEHLLAVTEAHLGSAAPEQVHWLHACWDAALTMRAEGATMRAVTVWSLFGSTDWSSLLTEHRGHYEPGAFDVSDGTPRPTLLAEAVRHLAERQTGPRPEGEAGWWARDGRLHAWLEESRSA
jgi:dTDP-4-dehydrorhamnose reductase